MVPATDATAPIGAGATATLPTAAQHQVLNGVDYRLNYYGGYCWRAPSAQDCVKPQAAGAIQYVRVVAAVTWTGPGCTGAGCAYVSATLLHESTEPIFNFNQSPPPKPVLKPVPGQTSAVGEAVDGIRGVTGCAVPCPVVTTNGVPPFVFTATGLPPGLSMDTGGLITGTPTTIGVYTVTVKVIDAFLGTASTSFGWTVFAPLVFDQPAPQHSVAGTAVDVQMTGAAGGSGAPYTWTASPLPGGATIDKVTGKISGTLAPSSGSSAPYKVTVTLTDSSGRTTSHAFDWTVDFAPLAAAPKDQASTRARAITPLPASALVTGGSGDTTWSAVTGLPPGLQVAADGKTITGTPSAVGTSSVSGTITDATTQESVQVSFTWTVYVPPALTRPSAQSTKSNGNNSTGTLQVVHDPCANGPCTFTMTVSPSSGSGLSIDPNTGLISAATGATKGDYSVTVTYTDAAGASASVTFTWSRT
jgi:hypothetical protein